MLLVIFTMLFAVQSYALTITAVATTWTLKSDETFDGGGNVGVEDATGNCVSMGDGDKSKGYFRGFDFSALPVGATVSNISIKMIGGWGTKSRREKTKLKINNGTTSVQFVDNKSYFDDIYTTKTYNEAEAGGKLFGENIATEWEDTDFKHADFGLEIQELKAKGGAGSTFCFDLIEITVTYTGGAPATCNPCYSVATGDWSNTNTWSSTSGGAAGATPQSNGTGDFVIEGGFTVNFDENFSVNELTVGSAGNGILLWTAASKTLTMKGVGGIVVAASSSVQENSQTDANISFPDANAYTVTIADAGTGLQCDNLSLGTGSTLNISGAGTVTLVDGGIQMDGNGIAFNNDVTGTFNVADDIEFKGTLVAAGGTTIWSENFESYADGVTTGGNNNTGNGANDWSLVVDGGGDQFSTGQKESMGDAQSFQVEDMNSEQEWVSESIDISSSGSVSVSIDWQAHGNTYDGDGDYLRMYYKLDGSATKIALGSGLIEDADMPGSHTETSGTASTTGITGTSLVLHILFRANDEHEYLMIDDIVVTGSAAAGGTGGGNNTFTNNETIGFTGADADISYEIASSNSFVNAGTITGLDDVEFNAVATAGAGATIWSENFESYADGVTTGGNNNTGNGANDWSLVVDGGGDQFSTGQKESMGDAQSFQVEDMNSEQEWVSESIDISSSGSVSVSIDWQAHGNTYDGDGDYLRMYYKLDGSATKIALGSGLIEDADMPGSHTETSGTASTTGITGTSLVLHILFRANDEHEYLMIDDIVVTGSAVGTAGGSNTFTNNVGKTVTFSGADANIDYRLGASNSFANNGTITGVADVHFFAATTLNTFVGGGASVTTINDSITFLDLAGNSVNSITNSGDFNVGSSIAIRQGDVTITNNAGGDIDVGGNLYMEDNNNLDTDINNTGSFTMVGDVILSAANEEADILNNTGGTFECANITANDGDLDITNAGTINQSGTFLINDADASFVNSTDGTWNYSGTGHDASTVLTCSASPNTFNYNAAGNQQMILVVGADYHHLGIVTSGTKTPLTGYVMDIEGDLTISGNAIFDVDAQNNNITIAGNWINSAAVGFGFTEGTESVTFDGASLGK